jgi:hypothetical protein
MKFCVKSGWQIEVLTYISILHIDFQAVPQPSIKTRRYWYYAIKKSKIILTFYEVSPFRSDKQESKYGNRKESIPKAGVSDVLVNRVK